jgi:hypothetical protein
MRGWRGSNTDGRDAGRWWRSGALCGVLFVSAACGNDAAAPIDVSPGGGDGANLRLDSVLLTQAVQNDRGDLPLVTGLPAAAKVLVTRSKESVAEVPLVLRLYRGDTLVYSDTARTGGVLGLARSFASSSADFLIPGNFVAPGIAWQIALDPGKTLPDSSRSDNLLPLRGPALLRTVSLPPLRVRLVPIRLARHGNLTGAVSAANAESYVRLSRQIFPVGQFVVSVGEPLVTQAGFGTTSVGGDRSFWEFVLGDLEAARVARGAGDEYWYGVVPLPPGYAQVQYGGLAYVPFDGPTVDYGSRSSAGLDVRASDGAYGAATMAHELGHNLGRAHAPGCNAPPPLDSVYPGAGGAIASTAHDVWSWANGSSIGAQSVGRDTPDVMSYCAPRWVSAHNLSAILQWRSREVTMARGQPVAAPRAVMVP